MFVLFFLWLDFVAKLGFVSQVFNEALFIVLIKSSSFYFKYMSLFASTKPSKANTKRY